jgi:hypothetical protein
MKAMSGLRIGLALTLAGCANPYSQFYQGDRELRRKPQFVAPREAPRVVQTDDIEREVRAAARKGLVSIGYSSFTSDGTRSDADYAASFARDIGAQVVILNTTFSHSSSGAMPLTLPTTSTTYSTGSATAYGPLGSATAYGSGRSTTYGSQTMLVPYTTNYSTYSAVFLALAPPPRLGIVPRPVPDDVRQRLGTNAGVLVWEVVEGSPAYAADVLSGDVLLAIADDRVDSIDRFYALIDKHQGTTVQLVLDRKGLRVEKQSEIRAAATPTSSPQGAEVFSKP